MLATKQQMAALVDTFHSGTRLSYNKGEFIIRPGETPTGVFFIETGLVKAYDITKYGEENLLIIRKEQEIFPLIWATTGQDRDVIYQTLAETIVWRLGRRQFMKYVSDPSSPLAPLLDLTMEMYRIHSERIMNLEYRTVRERLVSFLLTMSSRFGNKTDDGIFIEAPLIQQDIASSINASRETTSRELTALEKKGVIDSKNHFIIIKNTKKLRKYLHN